MLRNVENDDPDDFTVNDMGKDKHVRGDNVSYPSEQDAVKNLCCRYRR